MPFCPVALAARKFPHRCFIATPEEEISYERFDQMVERKKDQFLLGERETVALRAFPSLDTLVLFFAVWRKGGSLCPLNIRSPPLEIQKMCSRLSPHWFFDAGSLQRFSDLPSFASQSLFLFTSGSTHEPKIAVLSLQKLWVSASASSCVGLRQEDRWLLSLPLYHVGGIGLVLRTLQMGASLSLFREDPKITHISMVPAQLHSFDRALFPQLKAILLGGSPIAHYPKELPIYLTYGLTEMGSWVFVRKHPPQIEGKFYLGPPLPFAQCKIAPDGEVWLRGKTLFDGYWSEKGLEAPLDWFPTKDLALFNPKEGLAILGRKDFLFISGGENIQPEEIETALKQIPGIVEAIVTGQEDPIFGKRPIAFIEVKNENPSDEMIRNTLAQILPKYKIPLFFTRVPSFPKKGIKTDRKLFISNLQLEY